MTPITRQEASLLGAIRYFTGAPCKRGHVAERNTKSTACVACNAENMARWSRANPEKTRQWNAHTYAKKREVVITRAKAWGDANRGRRREICRVWAERHKDKVALYRMSARAKKAGCADDLTLDELRDLRAAQPCCRYCAATENLSFDHVISLAKGGPNTRSNLQVLCLPCNNAKRTTDEAEFLARRAAA